ncbi:trans-sialidase [Trypanosoma cruzi Dm28c]|uniref:Trans-sialidase n=2 Tax=Trypanosoma cruzi TaxID=5693 RepID=V5AQA0_TRYCR|nr:trans-sialidase [Trypanosoma cruzi Dm28c]PBJ76124.1 trans-sialidase [Trypanosoma cruzi cruzi]PWV03298.1 putative trans-sialidase [Trypanosoma cruzi]
MLSRVAAVKAPRTHNHRRVTGSSGRRREGRESERQRPNMSRRVFTSAVLLFLVVMMCCGTGGATADVGAAKAKGSSPEKPFHWRDLKKDGETMSSLRVPVLVEVNGGVFAVAEAQCKKNEKVLTGIASRLLTMEKGKEAEELLKDAKKDTQVLEEVTSTGKKEVDVSRPTAVVEGVSIYMLVGKHSHEDAATCKATTDTIKSGMLLVKGEVSEGGNKINWNDTDSVPCTLGEKHESLTGLIGGGGSGVKLKDGTIVFPVEATKKKKEKDGKAVSLILYLKDTKNWKLSKGMSADGCSVPSVVEWKGKLMMMTACDDGRRRVYESGDKGDSWTEALGTLSRVWFNKHEGNEKRVRSGFTTATIDGVEDNRNVMLVTLPVYPKEKEKGELHLWLTDNTHIVDIGPVSGDDDAAASALLYKSGESESGDDNKEELIALYEKKNDGEKPSLGMVSVLLTAQLQRVKDVLATWKEVDERVSKLCPSENAKKDASTDTACSTTVKITDGLVGFLSGNFSDNTWKDEYLGVNATVKKGEGATVATENPDGVTFKGRGAWAEWPVGRQGDNQLYHFANYNFTLVATVSIDKVPKEGSPIPLIGVKLNDSGNTVLLGLSYNKEKKWILLCGDGENKELSTWESQTQYQVAIVLRNGTQGSVYVDGKPLEGMPFDLKNKGSKEISHFYIGGDGGSAEGQEGLSVTVRNVLLYNRPLSSEEIAALAKNTITIPKPEVPKTSTTSSLSPAVGAQDVERTVTQSNSAGQLPLEEEPLTANIGAGAGGVSSAASLTTTPSSDADQTSVTVSGDKMRGNGSPQTPEVSVSSAEDGETAEGTDAQGEKGIHLQDGEVNDTALNSSLGNVSQGNNSDAGTMRGNGLLPSLLLLLLGLWVFAAL